MENYKELLDALKEIINTRIEQLETKLDLKNENTLARFNELKEDYIELKKRVEDLEKNKISTTWKNIKKAIINWIIPILGLGLIQYIKKG